MLMLLFRCRCALLAGGSVCSAHVLVDHRRANGSIRFHRVSICFIKLLELFFSDISGLHVRMCVICANVARSRQKPDTPFQPNLLNTCVFLISSAMQISTFVINYKV